MEFLKGKSPRSTLWLVSLGTFLAALLVVLLVVAGLPDEIIIFVYILFIVIANAVGFAFIIRRLNDLNKSGWWILCAFIPFINIAFTLVLLFVPGASKEANNEEQGASTVE